MADRERVTSFDGTPLSFTLKTQRARKSLAKTSDIVINGKSQCLEARSFLPEGYTPRIEDYAWDHPEVEQKNEPVLPSLKGRGARRREYNAKKAQAN